MDGILASVFLGFWSILEASWEANWSQNRPKKASKNDAKKKRHEVAQKALKDPDFAGETFGSFGEVIADFGACDTSCARKRGNWEI